NVKLPNSKFNSSVFYIFYSDRIIYFFKLVNMKGLSLILILLLVFPSISTGQEFRIAKDGKKFSMPFQEVGNLILVPVSINGSIPLNFIIDTGSPHTIITNIEAINYFQLKKGKSVFISGLGQNTRKLEAYLSNDNTLAIGKIGRASCRERVV